MNEDEVVEEYKQFHLDRLKSLRKLSYVKESKRCSLKELSTPVVIREKGENTEHVCNDGRYFWERFREAEFQTCRIIGRGGVGKSFHLDKLLNYWCCDENLSKDFLPLKLVVKKVRRQTDQIEACIIEQNFYQDSRVQSSDLAKLLNNEGRRKIILFVDDSEENILLHNSTIKPLVTNQYAENKLVVWSREEAGENCPSIYEIIGFHWSHLEEYFNKFLKHEQKKPNQLRCMILNESAGMKLFMEVTRSREFRNIAYLTPLIAQLFVILYQNNRDISQIEIEYDLFYEIVKLLKDDHIITDISERQLQEIAYCSIFNNKMYVTSPTENKFPHLMDKIFENSESVTWGFCHAKFEEYFAANYCLRQAKDARTNDLLRTQVKANRIKSVLNFIQKKDEERLINMCLREPKYLDYVDENIPDKIPLNIEERSLKNYSLSNFALHVSLSKEDIITKIEFENVNFSMKELLSKVKSLPNLKVLKIRGGQSESTLLNELLAAVKNCKLNTLVIGDIPIKLESSVEKITLKLKTISFTNCKLGYNEILEISRIVESSTPIKKLSLAHNNLRGYGIKQVLESLKKTLCFSEFAINDINLSTCSIINEDVPLLARLLFFLPDLHYLDISNNKIGDDGARMMLNSISDCNLSELKLQNCSISFLKFDFSHKICKELTLIDISNNELLDKSNRLEICDQLSNLIKLSNLSIGNCGFEMVEIKVIFTQNKGLGSHSLKSADFSGIDFSGDDGSNFLERFTNLKSLILANCNLNSIESILRRLSQLETLDISYNPLNIEDLNPSNIKKLYFNNSLRIKHHDMTPNLNLINLLRVIEFSNISIDNESFFSLIGTNEAIEQLDISNCFTNCITLEEIKNLLTHFNGLKVLNISRNTLTSEQISNILTNIFPQYGTKLEELYIFQTGLRKKHFIPLAKCIHNLKYLRKLNSTNGRDNMCYQESFKKFEFIQHIKEIDEEIFSLYKFNSIYNLLELVINNKFLGLRKKSVCSRFLPHFLETIKENNMEICSLFILDMPINTECMNLLRQIKYSEDFPLTLKLSNTSFEDSNAAGFFNKYFKKAVKVDLSSVQQPIEHCEEQPMENYEDQEFYYGSIKQLSIDHMKSGTFFITFPTLIAQNINLTSLILTNISISMQIIQSMKRCSNLVILSFFMSTFKDNSESLLEDVLNNNPNLNLIDFGKSDLKHETLFRIFKNCKFNNLEQIGFGELHINECSNFVNFISNHSELKVLDLAKCNIGNQTLYEIASELVRNETKTLRKLLLKGNDFDYNLSSVFCQQVLENQHKLHTFSISSNDIGTRTGVEILRTLNENCPKLYALCIKNCNMNCEAVESLSDIIEKMTNLKILRIGENKFGCLGSERILRAIAKRKNNSFLELNIEKIGLVTNDINLLGNTLSCHTNFTILEIDNNKLGNSVGKKLFLSIEKRLNNLKKLSLRECGFTNEIERHILKGLENLQKLQQFIFSGNQIGKSGKEILSKLKICCQNIEYIEMDDCNLHNSICSDLVKIAIYTRRLISISLLRNEDLVNIPIKMWHDIKKCMDRKKIILLYLKIEENETSDVRQEVMAQMEQAKKLRNVYKNCRLEYPMFH
ncbi:DgyrCDS3234 [Dimorphilus gyrociliatus]|uniref:DgyrCDS3234 n=1 Tax=Dimorphilus gyrociliatus TaxID=2664684 RepID=A0A7I8VHP1_9ANNE|nr:DgyrCDS3234 [Dimorphilus gyrociliatus]